MANLISGTSIPVRFDQFDISELLNGDIVSASSNSVVIDFEDGSRDAFTGTGIIYDSFGTPRGGTLTGLTESLSGTPIFTVTGLNYSVATFVNQAESGASTSALAGLFSGNDNLTGSPFDDALFGYDGHDNLFGGGGADTLVGGDGNDHLYGQSANGGADTADLINGGAGSDYIQGNAGNDILGGASGSDRIQGGQGDDGILGGDDNDTINGNLGNDEIFGENGNDSLRGGQGNDSLDGGAGNDLLSGDLGVDRLTGGLGSDIFLFSGAGSALSSPDVIVDYTDGVDRISLGFTPAAILKGAAQASLSAAAAFAQQLFDQHAGNGEVAAIIVGNNTYIFYASNGAAAVDSAIQLLNVGASLITVSDF
jgi:serralysin